jgi:hypothetical protein
LIGRSYFCDAFRYSFSLRHTVHEIEHAGLFQAAKALVDAHRLARNARRAAAVAADLQLLRHQ